MKDKLGFLKKHRTEFIFCVVVAAQFLFVCRTLFFDMKMTLDNDGAKTLVHFMEVWNEKKFFLPGWKIDTSLELQGVALLSLPFYGILNLDIFTAVALADIAAIGLYLFALLGICRGMGLALRYAVLSVGVLLIPYSLGQLGFYPSMFFGAGWYGLMPLIPLLFIAALLSDGKGAWFYLPSAGAFLLTLVSALCMGWYILFTGLIGLVFAYFFFSARDTESLRAYLTDKKKALCLLLSLTVVCGNAVYNAHGIVSRSGDYLQIASPEDFLENLRNFLTEFLNFMGGLPPATYGLENEEVYKTIIAIQHMAETLDIHMCAKGIDTQEQFEAYEEIGFFKGQGSLIAQPMPLEELEEYLEGLKDSLEGMEPGDKRIDDLKTLMAEVEAQIEKLK